MGRTPPGTVKETGAPAGAVLEGAQPFNAGLRIKVMRGQSSGRGGRIEGAFELLAPGTGRYASHLQPYVGEAFNAAKELIEAVKAQPGGEKCTHILNRNCLRLT